MRLTLLRTLGFGVPTLIIITWLHLAKEDSVGEAVDGLVSGLWFTALFLLGSCLRLRLGSVRHGSGRALAAREMLFGAAFAMLVWVLLWLFWQGPQSDSMHQNTRWPFAFNSATTFLTSLALRANQAEQGD